MEQPEGAPGETATPNEVRATEPGRAIRSQGPPPAATMLNWAMGHLLAQAIHVAAKIGVADHLLRGPRPVSELAELTGCHAPALYRLLRALASEGIFLETEPSHFCLTPLAATLASQTPDSVRAGAMLFGEPFYWQAWGNLEHSVRTGECAFEHQFGVPLFDYLRSNPESGALFDRWMSRSSSILISYLGGAYDFSRFRHLVDVGGGEGMLARAILRGFPELKATVFDAPEVAAKAIASSPEDPLRERCEYVGGDFFKSVPSGGDCYLMKFILHDWHDEPAARILQICRAAMTKEATLLVLEMVVPTGNRPHPSKQQDLSMLAINNGRERTEEEFGALFQQTGFELVKIVPTRTPLSILECRIRD